MKLKIIIDTDTDNINLDNLLNHYFIKYTVVNLMIKLKIKNIKDLEKFFNILMLDLQNTKLFNSFKYWLKNHNLEYIYSVIKEEGAYCSIIGNYKIKIVKVK